MVDLGGPSHEQFNGDRLVRKKGAATLTLDSIDVTVSGALFVLVCHTYAPLPIGR
jgi:hypothetical protein